MADLKMQAFQEFTEAYKQYSTVGGVANPAATTHQMMQALFDNWSASMYRMIQMYWQPKHEYKVGGVVWTATLPAGTIAKCTKAGVTAEAEPAWPKIVGGTATDGSVEWKLVVMCPEELPAKGGTADLAKNAEKLGGHLPAYFAVADEVERAIAEAMAGGTILVGDVIYRPYLAKGYVKANGATVKRSEYSKLVEFANTNNLWTSTPASEPWKYGVGDGNTTMVLPDYRNRFIQGGDNVVTKAAGLPQVNLTTAEAVRVQDGTVAARTAILETPNNGYGAVTNGTGFSKSAGVGLNISGNYSISNALKLIAKNAIYGNSSTVQPPAIILIPQLRY